MPLIQPLIRNPSSNPIFAIPLPLPLPLLILKRKPRPPPKPQHAHPIARPKQNLTSFLRAHRQQFARDVAFVGIVVEDAVDGGDVGGGFCVGVDVPAADEGGAVALDPFELATAVGEEEAGAVRGEGEEFGAGGRGAVAGLVGGRCCGGGGGGSAEGVEFEGTFAVVFACCG